VTVRPDQLRLDGRVAVVTGAAQGIGEAVASTFAGLGADLALCDRDADGLDAVVTRLRGDGAQVVACVMDVRNAVAVDDFFAATGRELGRVDVLVNNAAIYGDMEFDLLISVDWDYYRKFMSVNMDGALVMTRACYPEMQKRGGGSIVNQSSTAAYLYSGFYGLAKVGINGLTQQLAHELGGMNIRVNAIAPGPTDTEATRTQAGDAAKEMTKQMAIKRLGTTEDMVGTAKFLLSEDSSWISGQIIAVDGGGTFRL